MAHGIHRVARFEVIGEHTRYGLSHAAIKSVWLPAPPLPEQAAIARYLDEQVAAIAAAGAGAPREIDLLREYRTRMIADVVTGKLDVREAAAKLPDEAADDDAEPLDDGGAGTLDEEEAAP